MCPLDDIEHRRRRGRSVVQAQAPYREVVPDGVDRRFVAVPSVNLPSYPFLALRHRASRNCVWAGAGSDPRAAEIVS